MKTKNTRETQFWTETDTFYAYQIKTRKEIVTVSVDEIELAAESSLIYDIFIMTIVVLCFCTHMQKYLLIRFNVCMNRNRIRMVRFSVLVFWRAQSVHF